MALDKNSNNFTIGFAILMVIVVGAALSIAAMGLKPFQVQNIKQEKMQNVLAAIKVETSRKEASKRFSEYVEERIIIDSTGEVVSRETGEIDRMNEQDAFNLDPKRQYKQVGPGKINRFPLFKCNKSDSTFYVVPMAGTGLWGPIWGYVSIMDDHNTVYGAIFDHKSETPGLGAEISGPAFQKQFEGEQLLNEQGKFVSIDVVKGKTQPENKHAVDGITGGTITSHGVRNMLDRTLMHYVKYFRKLEKGKMS